MTLLVFDVALICFYQPTCVLCVPFYCIFLFVCLRVVMWCYPVLFVNLLINRFALWKKLNLRLNARHFSDICEWQFMQFWKNITDSFQFATAFFRFFVLIYHATNLSKTLSEINSFCLIVEGIENIARAFENLVHFRTRDIGLVWLSSQCSRWNKKYWN